jgi:hypothetical protein
VKFKSKIFPISDLDPDLDPEHCVSERLEWQPTGLTCLSIVGWSPSETSSCSSSDTSSSFLNVHEALSGINQAINMYYKKFTGIVQRKLTEVESGINSLPR